MLGDQDLVRAGLVKSTRGPAGAYELAYPAGEITLLEVRRYLEETTLDELARALTRRRALLAQRDAGAGV